MTFSIRALGIASLVAVAACKDKVAIARGDSLQTQLTQQQVLSNQLAEQKDSLTRVVLDADAFLGQMDSAISMVKGLPRSDRSQMDPLAAQVAARKEMMDRVNALVARAKTTSAQLAELQRQEAATRSDNAQLRQQAASRAAKIEADAQMIADLGATIERQNQEIVSLQARLDSLGSAIATLGARHYQAYYVIGTEQELIAQGVAVKEGGANLLIARPGRTLVPARVLNPAAFSSIDQRQVMEIQVPDTTKRYRVISRQSLDDAEVQARDGNTFRGNLRIVKPDEFWGASRFLILLKT
jgi:hypothetical protein